MGHFANISNGVVTKVVVSDIETIESGILGNPWMWLETSYNTRGGIHYNEDGVPDNGIPFRMNYAGIGFTYDRFKDAFIPPKPYNSWVLNETSCLWESPVPYPSDETSSYVWDENSINWIAQEIA